MVGRGLCVVLMRARARVRVCECECVSVYFVCTTPAHSIFFLVSPPSPMDRAVVTNVVRVMAAHNLKYIEDLSDSVRPSTARMQTKEQLMLPGGGKKKNAVLHVNVYLKLLPFLLLLLLLLLLLRIPTPPGRWSAPGAAHR